MVVKSLDHLVLEELQGRPVFATGSQVMGQLLSGAESHSSLKKKKKGERGMGGRERAIAIRVCRLSLW